MATARFATSATSRSQPLGRAPDGQPDLGGICALADFLSPQPPPRPRRRRYQAEPVSFADKEYVSVRDGWQCVYCGRWVTRRSRHIDHRVSRINGGTNHVNNLCVACVFCNLSKV